MDQTKLDEFLAVVVADLASTSSAVLVRIGDRLGFYRAMADAGPMTAAELAERTGTAQRYVQEWLNNQAAGGYVHYEAASGRYQLPEEHALVLADEASPVLMLGGFDLVATYFADEDTFVDAFRTGSGVGWHEHDPRLYPACERFFRPLYRGRLLQSWIPALDDVHDRLINGIEVADIGCGYGTSTVEMARAYPKSRFTGFDYHDVSISAARKAAAEAGVADRVHFEVATAAQFPGDYELVCHFDSLHDMGDPVGAAAHVRQALRDGGTWLLVEPMAGDSTEANMHVIGRIYYAGSTLLCTPSALAQGGVHALGNQVGEARWRELLGQAGFSRVRRAASTPFNLILEVRP
jgi:SAM-dependent methyltransferase